MKTNAHLFGIITRHGHQHGRRVHKAARAGQDAKARWYGNYGIVRYSYRLAAVYGRGGREEWLEFSQILEQAQATDPLQRLHTLRLMLAARKRKKSS